MSRSRVRRGSDTVAGITIAAFLVPQVMAYAALAGLPPVVGLWAAVPALVAYTAFGSSRHLSVGPESTTALLTATTIGPLARGQPTRYATLCAALALLVGGVFLVGWVTRTGWVANLLSRPILVGYLLGLALIMVAGQLGPVTGTTVHGDGFLPRLRSFAGQLGHIHAAPVVLATSVVLFLWATRGFARVPGPLLATALAAAVVALFSLDRHGIAITGPTPKGLPRPGWPHLGSTDVRHLVLPAIGIAVVAFSDDVLTARSFAVRYRYAVDANRELLALGVANLGSAVLHGLPVSCSASRTAIGAEAGVRTRRHGLVSAVAVVAVLVALAPLLSHFPTAALGGLVVFAATRLIDVDELRRLAAFRRTELLLALATCAGVLLIDVLYGVLLAIGLSILELLVRVAHPHDAIQGTVPGLAGMHDVDDYPTAETVPGLVVYRYDSPLFFANAEDFKSRALASVDESTRWFVLNVEANVEVDITALDALEELRAELDRRGIVTALARVKQDLLDDLRAAGLSDRIGPDRLFPTLPAALDAYRRWATDQQARPKGSP